MARLRWSGSACLGAALVEEVDHARDPAPLDLAGPLGGEADLGDHQVSSGGVRGEPGLKGVGDRPQPGSPSIGSGDDRGELHQEEIELALEHRAEALVEVGVVAAELGLVDAGAPAEVGHRDRGESALAAELDQGAVDRRPRVGQRRGSGGGGIESSSIATWTPR